MTHPLFTRGPLAALLISTALTGALATGAVQAGIPVTDAALASLVGAQTKETIARWVTQGAQMVRTINQGKEIIGQGAQMVQQGETLYHNFTDATYLQNYALGLASEQVRRPMPGDTNAVREAMSGALGFDVPNGMQLGGLVNGFMQRNVAYRPEGNDPGAVRIREEAGSNATQQALALTGYDAAGKRIVEMEALSSRIGRQATTAERADLQARITAEQAYAQAHTNQLLSLQIWREAEKERQDQKTRQLERQSADRFLAAADQVIATRGRGLTAATPVAFGQ